MKDVEMKEGSIKIAVREMLKGSKMLGEHCKVCGFPLFEDRKGNKYCVYCSVMKEKKMEKDKNDKIERREGKETVTTYSEDSYIRIVDRKIDYLFKKLDGEYDVTRIMEITDTIKALLKLKSKLE